MPAENVVDAIPHLGVLALGVFIGFLLGFALLRSKPTVKAAITVVGAALGGGPVVFMKDAGTAKWFYPIGLIAGLFFVRAQTARMAIGLKYENPTPPKKVHGYFAWLDLLAISVVAGAALIYAVLTK
jgi:hypothetical protein